MIYGNLSPQHATHLSDRNTDVLTLSLIVVSHGCFTTNREYTSLDNKSHCPARTLYINRATPEITEISKCAGMIPILRVDNVFAPECHRDTCNAGKKSAKPAMLRSTSRSTSTSSTAARCTHEEPESLLAEDPHNLPTVFDTSHPPSKHTQ